MKNTTKHKSLLHSRLAEMIDELKESGPLVESDLVLPVQARYLMDKIPSTTWDDLRRDIDNERNIQYLENVNWNLFSTVILYNPKIQLWQQWQLDYSKMMVAAITKLQAKVLLGIKNVLTQSELLDLGIPLYIAMMKPKKWKKPMKSERRYEFDLDPLDVAVLIAGLERFSSTPWKDIFDNDPVCKSTEIFYEDICDVCQDRLLTKYAGKRISIPKKHVQRKDELICLAYVRGMWFRLFKNTDHFCRYAIALKDEVARHLNIRLQFIDMSAMRKIIENNLEKTARRFLENPAR